MEKLNKHGDKGPVIYDLCYGSGEWSKPYEDDGYEVIRVDIKDGNQGDIRYLGKLTCRIRGVLFAPPCTDLAGSGARWWREKGPEALLNALAIVDAGLRFILINKPDWWCLENPVGRLTRYLGKLQYPEEECR